MIRVALADDQPVVRAGFRAFLDDVEDLAVVGEADNGDAAVSLARAARPDVLLMDIRMPVLDGLEATRRITATSELARVRIVILTTYELDDYVFDALRAGASGFLLKDIEPAELRRAVRVVAGGHALLAPTVTRRVIDRFAGNSPEPVRPQRLDLLTAREREVVAQVAAGLSNDEIAVRLHMSPLTAKTHVSRALTKLGLRDRTQLVIVAFETGLVRIGER